MSKEFEKKIEELFLHDQKMLDSKIINNILKEALKKKINEKGVLGSTTNIKQTSDKDIINLLPKFEFNEKSVGQVTTADRQQFESFIGPKIKAADSINKKIQVLDDFCNTTEQISDTQELLSNLTVLKILKNIVLGSSPGSSGYQFEAFIAALFGGVQVGDRSAVDVIINNELYQVKLLQEKGDTRIARRNIEAIKNQKINFIIVNKLSENKLIFYILKDVEAVVQDNKKEFRINHTQYMRKENIAGTISIGDEVFEKYSMMLKNNVSNVLSQTAEMINNINKFYFNNDTTAGRGGIQNANNVRNSLKRQVK
jgi:hypothetical protein